MARLNRIYRDGATFTDKLNSIADLRQRGFTINGNPTVVSASPRGGNCIKFDGTGDYIINSGQLFNMSGNLTLSAWVRIDTVVAGARVVDLAQAATLGLQITVTVTGTTPQLGFDNAGGPTSGIRTNVTAGEWYHVAITRASTTYTLYVNGVVNASTSGGTAPAYTRIAIGGLASGANLFTGQVSNVSVFPRAMTATEIINLYGNKNFNYMENLVSRWDFSEINPQDVGYKGYRNNGTGTSIVTSDIVAGHNSKNKAMNFDASANYVVVPTSASFDNTFGTNDYTMAVRYYPRGFVSHGSVINSLIMYGTNMAGATEAVTPAGTGIGFGSDNKLSFYANATGDQIVVALSVAHTLNQWNFVAVTKTSALMTISLNGTNNNSSSIVAASVGTGTPFNIGYDGSSTARIIDGLISNVFIFNKALTQLEIDDLEARTR